MSPSSETGGHGDCCACGGLLSAATTRDGREDFASTGEERIAQRGQCKVPRCVNERLQRAENIAE